MQSTKKNTVNLLKHIISEALCMWVQYILAPARSVNDWYVVYFMSSKDVGLPPYGITAMSFNGKKSLWLALITQLRDAQSSKLKQPHLSKTGNPRAAPGSGLPYFDSELALWTHDLHYVSWTCFVDVHHFSPPMVWRRMRVPASVVCIIMLTEAESNGGALQHQPKQWYTSYTIETYSEKLKVKEDSKLGFASKICALQS